MLLRTGLCFFLMTAASLLHAAPDAVVEGVQLPAWFTRDAIRKPLALGTMLESSDEVATGAGSRLLLRLADGSTVKLGENGRLQLADLEQRRKQGFIAATLKVLEGAFRFTTPAGIKRRGTRSVTVQFPTLTAGIRGTDIWGKNLGDREVLVLIEGKVTVKRTGEPAVELNEPLTYLDAPAGAASSIQAVPMEQLKAWAAQTEITEGAGALRRGGRWKLYLGSYREQREALALYDSLRRAGYPVHIRPQQTDDGYLYRVRLAGFSSETEANWQGQRLKQSNPGLEPVASLQ